MKSTKKLWLFAVVFTLLTLLLTLCASAETVSGNCGVAGNETSVTWSFDTETGVMTIEGKGDIANYSKGGAPWYEYKEQLTEVVIKDGVTRVGNYAFYGMKKLQSVSFPAKLTSIGEHSFLYCTSLDNVTIPGSVKNKIGDRAFQGCSSLKNLVLEEGITAISARIFMDCTALEEVVLPTTVTSIGYNKTAPFNGCTGLKSVTFLSKDVAFKPAVVEGNESTAIPLTAKIIAPVGGTVETYAKNNGYTFEEFEIALGEEKCGDNLEWSLSSDGVLTISGTGKMYAFTNTTMPWYAYRKIINKIIIEDGVTTVGDRAFSECSVKTVEIADSVTTLRPYSFRICKNLTDFHIGSGVTYIGEYVINDCDSLTTLVIPGNVITLENHAINVCDNLTSVILGDGIENLRHQAINGCGKITEIVIPSTVKTMGVSGKNLSAINDCAGLEKITILSKDVKIYPESAAGLPESAVIYGYKDSTAEAYATKYQRNFVELPLPFASKCSTGFDITANAIKAAAGEYLALVSIQRMTLTDTVTLTFLAVDENGALYTYTPDGKPEALFDDSGKSIILADGTEISIVYNDDNGTARLYVNKLTPKYGKDLKSVVNYAIAGEDFLSETAVSEQLLLADGVTAINVRTTEDTSAVFAGFQTNGNNTSIRVIAGIDELYYDYIGFEISLYSNDVLQNTITKTTKTVFSSFINEKTTVTADELGFKYLALGTISNIDYTKFPENAEVYFKIKPFSVIGGEKLYGREKRITVTYDYENGKNEFTYGVEAPFVPVLRFIATSDIHFKGAQEGDSVGDGAPKLKTMMSQLSEFVLDETKNDGYTGLDAVILAGDIANNGTAYQFDLAKNYLGEIIPEDTELVITMGNHDWLGWETNTPAGNLKMFEDAFGAATKDVVINGYHFITICDDGIPAGDFSWRGYGWDYSAETVAYAEKLIEAAIKDTGPDKPVFVIQHVPNAETVAGSNVMAPCYTLKEMQAKYSNLVIFAGHSHHPINDECSIHQENNTAIGTGTIQVSQLYLVEVDEYGRVRVRNYSSAKQDFMGETWFIDSYDPRDFVYTEDRFTEDDMFFADGAEIIPEYIGADNISFQFLPVPAESLTARGYRIVLKDSSGSVISSEIVEHSYRNEDFTTPIKHSFTALTPDTNYTVEVTALNPMYETDFDLDGMFESEPLVLNFKTAATSDIEGGDLISLYINSTTQSAVNTASSGLTATIKGAPKFTHDRTIGMDVVSFDGSNTQAIVHDYSSVASQIKDGFAVEAYFKIDEAPSKTLVAFGALQSSAFGLQINTDKTINFIIHNNSEYVYIHTTENYEVGKYYHVVGVYDGEKAHFYVDGKLVGSADMPDFKLHDNTSWHKLLIGADNDRNAGIQSASKTTFAKFNLYSEPLTADEIAETYNKLPKQSFGDLIAMSINSGNVVNPASSALKATVSTSAPTFSHDETIGMDVVSFNGVDKQAISYNFYSVYEQLVDGFTVEAYFKIDEAPTEKSVVAFGAMQSCWFGLSLNTDKTMTFKIHSGEEDYNNLYYTNPYEIDKYYHVVATYDQAHTKLYVNGELVDTIEMTNLRVHSKDTAYKVRVGADFDLDKAMSDMSKTTFALFNMYSEPLTKAEIIANYNKLS